MNLGARPGEAFYGDIALLAALAAWWLYFYPRYMISTPAQRDGLGIGFTLLAVGLVGYGVTRKTR
jgi:hypothetical protein